MRTRLIFNYHTTTAASISTLATPYANTQARRPFAFTEIGVYAIGAALLLSLNTEDGGTRRPWEIASR